jgi:mRNA interferase RelE/StbE
MKILQSRSFAKKVKKPNKREKSQLDDQIRSIIKNPYIGIEKTGDLKGIFVHKFKLKTIQYILAYRTIETNLELIMLGPHENYYRDLKKTIQ